MKHLSTLSFATCTTWTSSSDIVTFSIVHPTAFLLSSLRSTAMTMRRICSQIWSVKMMITKAKPRFRGVKVTYAFFVPREKMPPYLKPCNQLCDPRASIDMTLQELDKSSLPATVHQTSDHERLCKFVSGMEPHNSRTLPAVRTPLQFSSDAPLTKSSAHAQSKDWHRGTQNAKAY